MKSSIIAIIGLSLLVGLTNGWWIYKTCEQAVSLDYMQESLKDNQTALDQALFLSKLLSQGKTLRGEIVPEIEKKFGITDTFEKEGYVWVGHIGLGFDSKEHFIEAIRGWQ